MPRLMRAPEVAEALGVPMPRFRKWVREGYFPSIRVGRAHYFTAAMVERWLAQGAGSGQEAAGGPPGAAEGGRQR